MKTKPPFQTTPGAADTSTKPASMSDSSVPARRMVSDDIFGNHHEIEIEHNGALYRLRKTSLGKLILTK